MKVLGEIRICVHRRYLRTRPPPRSEVALRNDFVPNAVLYPPRRHPSQPLKPALFQKSRSTDLDYIIGAVCARYAVPDGLPHAINQTSHPKPRKERSLSGNFRRLSVVYRYFSGVYGPFSSSQPDLSPMISTAGLRFSRRSGLPAHRKRIFT